MVPPGQLLATRGNGALETCYVPLRNCFKFCLILISSHLNLVAIILDKCRYELWSQTVRGTNPDSHYLQYDLKDLFHLSKAQLFHWENYIQMIVIP